jgi:uncharacterized protein YndB with AHSA1/START domain
MTSEALPAVSVSRTIEAPPQQLFELLVHSANHPVVDGSGMLKPVSDDVVLTGVGDVFTIAMHNPEMGDYEMSNHVAEFEPNRRISWEPVMTAASRPEDKPGLGQRTGHTWSYELTPVDSGSTLVTETYDCSRAPEWLRQAVKGGDRWIPCMTATLEKLEDLVTRPAG